jgi:Mn2+/Fe2+ NRAMP family transporter
VQWHLQQETLFPQIPLNIFNIFFTILIIITILKIAYKKYVRILKYLALAFYIYIITAIIVGSNWYQILYATFIPHFEISIDFATMLVAVYGTTISPYLFFLTKFRRKRRKDSKTKNK